MKMKCHLGIIKSEDIFLFSVKTVLKTSMTFALHLIQKLYIVVTCVLEEQLFQAILAGGFGFLMRMAVAGKMKFLKTA